MSSDPFRLLGLDRKTATEADVRRAYAERLKVTRPEDDRAGFMALRTAFEQARSEARWREQYGDEESYEDEDAYEDDAGAAVPDAAEESGTDAHVAMSSEDQDAEPHLPDAVHSEVMEYEDSTTRAMDALVDVLTAAPFGVSVKQVMTIVEADEVSGIEDYQSLQWQVRNFLCDRTGYNLEPQEMRRPDWLTLELFDALDGYFGWTRQPVTQPWVRKMNDWLVRVRKRIVWENMPEKERAALRSTAMERSGAIPDTPASNRSTWSSDNEGESGSLRWLFIGAGIIIYGVVQFFIRTSGGG